jgi:2-methylcitrate dehydratase PrpD
MSADLKEHDAATTAATLAERLVDFALAAQSRGVPEEVLHETKRLVINQLKASVAATDNEVIRILSDWGSHESIGRPAASNASMLWLGHQVSPQHAAMVNGALFEVLDFHDTYIPTYMHAVSAVLPAVLAIAEVRQSSGKAFLTALALGVEVELALATMLMPTGYYRGFVPAGLVGALGAAVACSVLAGLDRERMRNALSIAMCTAFGLYESVGSMSLSYITGATARSGLTAFELAERGMDGPRTAFEGERGMFVCHTNEDAVKIEPIMATLGNPWRIFGQTYKTVPTETITHGPIECVLAIKAIAGSRVIQKMRFGVEAIVVKIVKERMERFGDPSSELTARFDLCHCAAAAWERGRFTLDEMREPAYTDAAILDLRQRIELVADHARKTFEGCWLEAEFTDGSSERFNVDAFLGSPGNRMSDAQLTDVFTRTATGVMSKAACEAVLEAAWRLDTTPNMRDFVKLVVLR